jgi:hypothetical protein
MFPGLRFLRHGRRSSAVVLASAFPPLHDLPERSANLAPRLAGCDAAIAFRFQYGLLSVCVPLSHVSCCDLLPRIKRWCWFGRFGCIRGESTIAVTVRVEFFHRFNALWCFDTQSASAKSPTKRQTICSPTCSPTKGGSCTTIRRRFNGLDFLWPRFGTWRSNVQILSPIKSNTWLFFFCYCMNRASGLHVESRTLGTLQLHDRPRNEALRSHVESRLPLWASNGRRIRTGRVAS